MTAFVLTAVLTVAAPVPEAADEQFEKGVSAAREKAIDYLKKQQKPQGNWEGIVIGFLADMEGGSTALVVFGLLEAGVPANDPAVAKAVDYLVTLDPKKTYVVSLQTQVLARVDARKHAVRIQANADWLLKQALRKGDRLEGWSYPQNNIADGSNTHFAVVGLHAAAQAGAKVDAKVWKEIREFYTRTQRKDGGWSYYGDARAEASSAGMTGAALVGLSVAAKYDKQAKKPDPAFEKGMATYTSDSPQAPKSLMYNMMVTARLGRVLGVTEFKSGDKTWAWYREGAEMLVKKQNADGSWSFGRQIDGTAHLSTAFGLYFLGPPPLAN